MKPIWNLEGRGALVTGSTQGIGRAIAASLGEAGATVVHHGLEPVFDEGELGLTLDLARPDAAALLVERALELVPHLDVLVCNAGVRTSLKLNRKPPACADLARATRRHRRVGRSSWTNQRHRRRSK